MSFFSVEGGSIWIKLRRLVPRTIWRDAIILLREIKKQVGHWPVQDWYIFGSPAIATKIREAMTSVPVQTFSQILQQFQRNRQADKRQPQYHHYHGGDDVLGYRTRIVHVTVRHCSVAHRVTDGKYRLSRRVLFSTQSPDNIFSVLFFIFESRSWSHV